MGSIPSGVVALLRGSHPLSPVSPNLVVTCVDCVLHLHAKIIIVCSLFQQNIITLPAVTTY